MKNDTECKKCHFRFEFDVSRGVNICPQCGSHEIIRGVIVDDNVIVSGQQARNDLIDFFEKWLHSNLELLEFILRFNFQLYEKEIGRYRFDRLSIPLREMKIYNFRRMPDGNLLGVKYKNIPYDREYIESFTKDIRSGIYDRYLQISDEIGSVSYNLNLQPSAESSGGLNKNNVERSIDGIKNNKILAPFIVIGIAVIAIAAVLTATRAIRDFAQEVILQRKNAQVTSQFNVNSVQQRSSVFKIEQFRKSDVGKRVVIYSNPNQNLSGKNSLIFFELQNVPEKTSVEVTSEEGSFIPPSAYNVHYNIVNVKVVGSASDSFFKKANQYFCIKYIPNVSSSQMLLSIDGVKLKPAGGDDVLCEYKKR